MTLLQLSLIAIIQGITEFLPVSSSGHLRLVPLVTGWPDQGLTIDIAVHVGTLGAVIIYFWRDMLSMSVGVAQILRGHNRPATRLVGHLIIASIPVIIAGTLLLHYGYDSGALSFLRTIEVVGWTMLGFGIVLLFADRQGMTLRRLEHMSGGSALLIGLAQILALVPGTSRAGITITAARILGFERVEAARFALLMSVPAIISSATASGWRVYNSGNIQLGFEAILAAGLAFIAALISIAAMMRWLKYAGFTPFIIYRVALGAAILIWFYGFQST